MSGLRRLTCFLIDHPTLNVVAIFMVGLSVWFGVDSCMESKRQTEWQQSDEAWAERDDATNQRMEGRQEKMLMMLTEIKESCAE